ncbi:hypothetical protein QQ045_001983 [Rhodiola kirilowii]
MAPLNASSQLTSNALAMVTQLSDVFASLHIPGLNSRRRRQLLSTNPSNLKPNVFIAKDGSGDYKTLSEAVPPHIPKKSNTTYVIYVKEGVYTEQVIFNSSHTHVFLYGDGPTKTKITRSLNYMQMACPLAKPPQLLCWEISSWQKNIRFENSAGPEKHQAVALRVQSDFSVFQNCQMDGYQDTLYTHTPSVNTTATASSPAQSTSFSATHQSSSRTAQPSLSSLLLYHIASSSLKLQENYSSYPFTRTLPGSQPHCYSSYVTAQGRKERRQPSGIIIQGSKIIADPELESVKSDFKSYLGRPWKAYSRTIIMETFIDDLIAPEGWTPWAGDINTENCLYGEYQNSGPGASRLRIG